MFHLLSINNKINMKNIIAGITIMLFFTSCGDSNKSATNDVGDINKYVDYQEKLKNNPEKIGTWNDISQELETGENMDRYDDFQMKAENNPDATVSIENVISEGGPIFEFSNVVWDFGEIKQGESVDHVFRFINTGSEPLIISNAKGSCGCTVPDWPKEPILPNSVGEIAVQFNSGEKKGRQNKTVTLTTNCTPNTTILRVVGNILID